MSARQMNRTERLAIIEQMLFHSDVGLRAVEIARACEVDRRTVYRDLSLLSQVGIPIHQRDGRFYLDRERYTATVRLNFDETIALFLSARVQARTTATMNPHTASALDKLGKALPAPIARHVHMASKRGNAHLMEPQALAILDVITRAWGAQRKVKLWCTGTEGAKPRAREFSTYFVEPAPTGTLVVVGFDSITNRLRAFRLPLIRRARLLSATYQIPAPFDAQRYLTADWGVLPGERDERQTVVLVFAPEAASAVRERSLQTGARTEVLNDKRLKVTLTVVDWRDLLPWIRSWGAQVEVLEPPALREECALEAARLTGMYSAQAWT